jgi:hypothetical protein
MSNYTQPIDTGDLDEISLEDILSRTFNHIEIILPQFSQAMLKTNIKIEKGFTQELCKMLNREVILPIIFDRDNMENTEDGHSPSTDFGVYPKSKLVIERNGEIDLDGYEFLRIEAKILGVKEAYREKEYLIGMDSKKEPKLCGGVERFKLGIHGSKLQQCGMIGYLVEGTFEEWHDKINTWVKELSNTNTNWSETEKLQQLYIHDFFCECNSEHDRVESISPKVKIKHYWVYLKKQPVTP